MNYNVKINATLTSLQYELLYAILSSVQLGTTSKLSPDLLPHLADMIDKLEHNKELHTPDIVIVKS